MDKSVPSWLRTLFFVHMIVSLVIGVAMYLVPGRTLSTLGWVPGGVQLPNSELMIKGETFVDPVMTRLVAAALIALAFSSFRGLRAKRRAEVEILVGLEAIFCILGVGAFVAWIFLGEREMPFIGWVFALLLAVFGVLWLYAMWPKRSS